MKNFRTYQLALNLHRETVTLTVTGELRDQLTRASLSVVLNLAEGSAKLGKDRLRFFRTAMGSLREVQACFDVLNNNTMQAKASEVGGSLYKLLQNPGR